MGGSKKRKKGGREVGRSGGRRLPGDNHGRDELAGAEYDLRGVVNVV